MTFWPRNDASMAWKIEARPSARNDLDRVFEHLFQSAIEFSYDSAAATQRAESRILHIVESLVRIATEPRRGTLHRFRDKEYRHLTMDRAIYWFTLDVDTGTVRIEGIFYGGQDHMGRMVARLTSEGKGA